MKIYRDINYSTVTDSAHKIDLWLPEGECKALLVYFHGGGFVEGSRDLAPMTHFAEDMTDVGIGVASAEYRMYPEAKYPDFIEDAAEAVAYAKRELTKIAGCDKLIVSGTSAGAYLTLMLCFNEEWLEKHGVSNSDIVAYVHDAGQPTSHFNVLKERGLDPTSVIIDDAAPVFHIKKCDYPPMRIIVSDNDMAGRREQTEDMIEKLLSLGYAPDKLDYTVTHGTHVWYVTKTDNDGRNEFANLIIPFIKRHI